MLTCSAYNCTNSRKTCRHLSFHGFPLKNKELLQKWVDATRRANFTPTSNSCLCSAHFTKNDYQIRPGAYIPYLRTTAVPSVFCFANRGNRMTRKVLRKDISNNSKARSTVKPKKRRKAKSKRGAKAKSKPLTNENHAPPADASETGEEDVPVDDSSPVNDLVNLVQGHALSVNRLLQSVQDNPEMVPLNGALVGAPVRVVDDCSNAAKERDRMLRRRNMLLANRTRAVVLRNRTVLTKLVHKSKQNLTNSKKPSKELKSLQNMDHDYHSKTLGAACARCPTGCTTMHLVCGQGVAHRGCCKPRPEPDKSLASASKDETDCTEGPSGSADGVMDETADSTNQLTSISRVKVERKTAEPERKPVTPDPVADYKRVLHDHSYSATRSKEYSMERIQARNQLLRVKVKSLQTQARRQQKKIQKLEQIINDLRKENHKKFIQGFRRN